MWRDVAEKIEGFQSLAGVIIRISESDGMLWRFS